MTLRERLEAEIVTQSLFAAQYDKEARLALANYVKYQSQQFLHDSVKNSYKHENALEKIEWLRHILDTTSDHN